MNSDASTEAVVDLVTAALKLATATTTATSVYGNNTAFEPTNSNSSLLVGRNNMTMTPSSVLMTNEQTAVLHAPAVPTKPMNFDMTLTTIHSHIMNVTPATGPWSIASHVNGEIQSVAFILIPLLLIVGLAVISGMALYCIQRRNRLDRLRHRLIPMYTFAPGDEDEWGVLLTHEQNRHSSIP